MRSTINTLFDKIVGGKKINFLFFFTILAFLTLVSELANRPFYIGHDMHVHFTRIQSLMDAFREGNYPWYISYNGLNQYGYFIKAFYPDILLIPFALIGLLSNAFFAFRCMVIANTFLTGILCYWAIRKVYGNGKAATLGGLLYAFCSYRLIDIYTRAAIGEVFAFTLLPLIFVAGHELIKGDYKKWYLMTIGYSLLLFSHLLSTVMTTLVLGIFCLIYIKRFIKEPIRIKYFVLSALATVFVAGIYIFPMLEQMTSNEFYYDLETTIPHNLGEYCMSVSRVVKGMFDAIPAQIYTFLPDMGVLLTLAICARVFVSRKADGNVKRVDGLVIFGLVLVFASTNLFPWGVFPLNKLSFIQFPWRFFMYASLFFAIGGGYYLSQLLTTSKKYILFVIGLMVVSVIVIQAQANVTNYQLPNVTGKHCIADIEPVDQFHYGGLEYLPAKVPSRLFLVENSREVLKQDSLTQVSNYVLAKGKTSFDLKVVNKDVLELPITYYKGYKAYLDDKEIAIEQSEHGLIQIESNESGKVAIFYSTTTIQLISSLVSCLSILLICFYIFRKQKLDKKRLAVK